MQSLVGHYKDFGLYSNCSMKLLEYFEWKGEIIVAKIPLLIIMMMIITKGLTVDTINLFNPSTTVIPILHLIMLSKIH